MPRFSETPVSEDLASGSGNPDPITAAAPESPHERSGTSEDRKGSEAKTPSGPDAGTNSGSDERARGLIEYIGSEFNRLRQKGRAQAWGSLEEKVAASGHILVPNMMSAKDWVGMLIDIEQFRKAEGGTAQSPGDVLAAWLTEEEVKPKKSRKVKVGNA